ncbi:hypothetical protein SNEBB_002439 [Seison nebaliae]|nr:hypothetical protein SNEBB_002439 [Seison nebaliae]
MQCSNCGSKKVRRSIDGNMTCLTCCMITSSQMQEINEEMCESKNYNADEDNNYGSDKGDDDDNDDEDDNNTEIETITGSIIADDDSSDNESNRSVISENYDGDLTYEENVLNFNEYDDFGKIEKNFNSVNESGDLDDLKYINQILNESINYYDLQMTNNCRMKLNQFDLTFPNENCVIPFFLIHRDMYKRLEYLFRDEGKQYLISPLIAYMISRQLAMLSRMTICPKELSMKISFNLLFNHLKRMGITYLSERELVNLNELKIDDIQHLYPKRNCLLSLIIVWSSLRLMNVPIIFDEYRTLLNENQLFFNHFQMTQFQLRSKLEELNKNYMNLEIPFIPTTIKLIDYSYELIISNVYKLFKFNHLPLYPTFSPFTKTNEYQVHEIAKQFLHQLNLPDELISMEHSPFHYLYRILQQMTTTYLKEIHEQSAAPIQNLPNKTFFYQFIEFDENLSCSFDLQILVIIYLSLEMFFLRYSFQFLQMSSRLIRIYRKLLNSYRTKELTDKILNNFLKSDPFDIYQWFIIIRKQLVFVRSLLMKDRSFSFDDLSLLKLKKPSDLFNIFEMNFNRFSYSTFFQAHNKRYENVTKNDCQFLFKKLSQNFQIDHDDELEVKRLDEELLEMKIKCINQTISHHIFPFDYLRHLLILILPNEISLIYKRINKTNILHNNPIPTILYLFDKQSEDKENLGRKILQVLQNEFPLINDSYYHQFTPFFLRQTFNENDYFISKIVKVDKHWILSSQQFAKYSSRQYIVEMMCNVFGCEVKSFVKILNSFYYRLIQ